MTLRETGSMPTLIGTIRIETDGDTIAAIRIGDDAGVASDHRLLRAAADQIEAYFAGARRVFDLPLAPSATVRGQVLRQAIVDIGYGDVASYGAIARRIGSSPRALGQACARNPIPIIVPCHRVLGANRVLGAYSAGNGPSTKQWMLDHEQGFSL